MGCCGGNSNGGYTLPGLLGRTPVLDTPEGKRLMEGEAFKKANATRIWNFGRMLASYVKGVVYGPASEEVKIKRFEICKACQETDSKGERLFREIKGEAYCGVPQVFADGLVPGIKQVAMIARDETLDGCGCNLALKTSKAEAACPKKKWLEESKYDGLSDGRPAVKIRLTKNMNQGGIGDTVTAAFAVAGYVHDHPDEQVFFEVPFRLVDWAKLFTDAAHVIPAFPEDTPVPEDLKLPVFTKEFELLHTYSEKEIPSHGEKKRHEFYADVLGTQPRQPKIQVRNVDREAAMKRPLSTLDTKTVHRAVIGLQPFTDWPVRQWPVRRWVELEDMILSAGYGACVFDGSRDRNKTAMFRSPRHIADNPSIQLMMMLRTSLVVGIDSMLCHLAGATGHPAISLCGPIKGEVVFGQYQSVHVLQAPMHCTGCYFDEAKGFRRSCNFGCDALEALSAGRVFEEIQDMLRVISRPMPETQRVAV